MSNDWYVKLDGKTDRGPLSSDALRRLAQQGRVTPDTPVKKGQAGAWHRANDVHGLFAEPSGQSTPATAKPSSKPASSAAISTTKPQSVLPRAVPPNAPPPPPSEQVGEMAASRIGRVAPPTPVAESPSAALAEAVARREDQTGIALPAPRQGRISTQLSRKERDFAPSLIYLAIGAIVLVAVTVGATFWATGFLARSQSAGVDSSATLGKNSNSAETAQSPAPSPAPSAPTPKINYVVKGEIFVTTKGGDVKKVAGLRVSFIPVTAEVRGSFAELLRKDEKSNAEAKSFIDSLNAKYPIPPRLGDVTSESIAREQAVQKLRDKEFDDHIKTRPRQQSTPALDAARRLLNNAPCQTVTNGDGCFSQELPGGEILLLTEQRQILNAKLLWCKAITSSENINPIVLDQTSAVFGKHFDASSDGLIPEENFDIDEYDILKAVAKELCIR